MSRKNMPTPEEREAEELARQAAEQREAERIESAVYTRFGVFVSDFDDISRQLREESHVSNDDLRGIVADIAEKLATALRRMAQGEGR